MSRVPGKINVLVVDDSAFMRRAIAKMLEKESDIVVCGIGANGQEGIDQARALRPDIITMDVEMPGVSGLEACRTIVAERIAPIIMVSSLTRQGAETTLKALDLGAVDFIPKPDSAYIDILKVAADLVDKVRTFGGPGKRTTFLAAPAARTSVPPVRPAASAMPIVPPRPSVAPRAGRYECVAIGTSTGGPVALSKILPALPADFPVPIVVVQHMPPGFTKPLAERLDAVCKLRVVEGVAGMKLARGTVMLAPAGQQIGFRRVGSDVEVRLFADERASLHVPSVDALIAAAADIYGAGTLGVILTGMGHDGVEGLKVAKQRGGYVLGQDEASCVVYGMPRAAAVANLVDRVVSLGDVAAVMCELTGAPGTFHR